MESTYKLTYYPWIAQHKTKEEIARQIRRFADAVEGELKTEIEVLPPIDVPEQIAAIADGTCQIALMNPLGYVFARARNKDVAAIAVAQRIIRNELGNVYFAQIYTHNETGITKDDLSKIRGRSIGFGVPYSTSNFLVPAAALKKIMGLHPFTAFSRNEYLGGHDDVAKAVYNRSVDLGAGHDGVIDDLNNQPDFGNAKNRLKTLITIDIPSDPIAVLIKDENERAVLQKCLVFAGKTPAGKAALGEFWGKVQGLAPTTPDKYDELNVYVSELGLSQADLIKAS
jgi:ABC-type phosphate/phosphonate transport system substrate-binding protein